MSESHADVMDIFWAVLDRLKTTLFPLAFFGAFMALCMRGVFEVTIGKSLAYVVQLLSWTFVQFAAVTIFRAYPTRFLSLGLLLTFLFGTTAVISSFLTLSIFGATYGLVTTVVNIYLLLLFVAGYGFRTEAFSARPIVLSMAVAGMLLPLFGALQMVGIAELPGRSLIRPPSLTGSFLHFPLLCGVLGICLMQAAKSLRWRLLYLIALFCFFGVVISGGRSGALVLVATGGLYILFEFSRQPPATKFKFAVIALIVVTTFVALVAVGYQFVPALQRIGRLWDLQETGNALRVTVWTLIYTYWSNTNLWFGEYTGLVGNASGGATFTGLPIVAESGALQQLINFGMLGFLLFYAVMLLTYFDIDKENTYLRALFISAMIQTSFYQLTEVFPYMAMLAFLPIFSRSLLAAAGNPYSNQGRWGRLGFRFRARSPMA